MRNRGLAGTIHVVSHRGRTRPGSNLGPHVRMGHPFGDSLTAWRAAVGLREYDRFQGSLKCPEVRRGATTTANTRPVKNMILHEKTGEGRQRGSCSGVVGAAVGCTMWRARETNSSTLQASIATRLRFRSSLAGVPALLAAAVHPLPSVTSIYSPTPANSPTLITSAHPPGGMHKLHGVGRGVSLWTRPTSSTLICSSETFQLINSQPTGDYPRRNPHGAACVLYTPNA